MNTARVAERGLAVRSALPGRLDNYRLVFNKVSRHHPGVAHANIEFQPGAQVEGVLYELESDAEILKMDVFENSPINYGRDVVRIVCDRDEHSTCGPRQHWSWTYFANPAVLANAHLPTQEYLDHLLAGAPFLSEAYYQALQAQPVMDN